MQMYSSAKPAVLSCAIITLCLQLSCKRQFDGSALAEDEIDEVVQPPDGQDVEVAAEERQGEGESQSSLMPASGNVEALHVCEAGAEFTVSGPCYLHSWSIVELACNKAARKITGPYGGAGCDNYRTKRRECESTGGSWKELPGTVTTGRACDYRTTLASTGSKVPGSKDRLATGCTVYARQSFTGSCSR